MYNLSQEVSMKVGDLVRNIHTDEVFIITSRDPDNCINYVGNEYVEVDSQWLIPEEDLEVVSESR
jgi:hypothetical protein